MMKKFEIYAIDTAMETTVDIIIGTTTGTITTAGMDFATISCVGSAVLSTETVRLLLMVALFASAVFVIHPAETAGGLSAV
jgi:hypothetical protein